MAQLQTILIPTLISPDMFILHRKSENTNSIQELGISTIKTSQNDDFPYPLPPRVPHLRGAGRHVVQGAKLSEGILRYRNRVWKMNFPFESAKELIFILVSA